MLLPTKINLNISINTSTCLNKRFQDQHVIQLITLNICLFRRQMVLIPKFVCVNKRICL